MHVADVEDAHGEPWGKFRSTMARRFAC